MDDIYLEIFNNLSKNQNGISSESFYSYTNNNPFKSSLEESELLLEDFKNKYNLEDLRFNSVKSVVGYDSPKYQDIKKYKGEDILNYFKGRNFLNLKNVFQSRYPNDYETGIKNVFGTLSEDITVDQFFQRLEAAVTFL